MRKLLILIVIVAAAAGGYGAYWYKKADEVKANIEKAIATINEQAKTRFGVEIPVVQYGSLDVQGFPLDMQIRVAKPVLTIPASKLVEHLKADPQGANAMQFTPVYKEWTETITYNGDVYITSNIAGEYFTILAPASSTLATNIEGTLVRTLENASAGPVRCHLNIAKLKDEQGNRKSIFTDYASFMSGFLGAGCESQASTIKDANGTLYFTADATNFFIKNAPESKVNRNIHLVIVSPKSKFEPAFDALIKDYITLVMDIQGVPASLRSEQMINLSEYGEMVSDIDMTYTGPVFTEVLNTPERSIQLNVDKFVMRSALSDSDFTAKIKDIPTGDTRDITAVINSRAKFNERYDEVLAQELIRELKELQSPGENDAQPQRQAAASYQKLGDPTTVVTTLLPKFAELGDMKLALDVNVRGKNESSAYLRQGSYTINDISFSTAAYSLALGGSADLAQTTPVADMTLKCGQCDTMLSRLGNYAMLLEQTIGKMQPTPTSYVTAALVSDVKKFVRGIASNGSDASATDLSIQFIAKDGQYTISGQPFMQVMQQFNTLLMPHFMASRPQPIAPATSSPSR